MPADDTIVAVSTPPGRGGIGIVRLSGDEARRIAESLLLFPAPPTWKRRRAVLATLIDESGGHVDQVVVTFFEKPHSYTAEDVVEISCHGSPVVLGFAVERALQAGARLAEPGEFTQRAYLNGRLDLPQAEAVRDLIESTTLYQARVALQQVEGALSQRLAPLKNQLRELIALLEAGIDFAEDDLPVAGEQQILARLAPVREGIARLAESFRYGKVIRGGVTLAILGRPNVGKSSVFNRLLEQERAIVTPQAGTTRDLVSEFASIHGLPVKLVDTAGIRAATDVAEAMGVERSYQALADADLILVIIDLSEPLSEADRELLEKARGVTRRLVIGNKCDLPQRAELGENFLRVSAATGEGIGELRQRIFDLATPRESHGEEAGFITNIRHERLLLAAVACLERAEAAALAGTPHEMLLLDLYEALSQIDALTGATTMDDILQTIFSTFCIGK